MARAWLWNFWANVSLAGFGLGPRCLMVTATAFHLGHGAAVPVSQLAKIQAAIHPVLPR